MRDLLAPLLFFQRFFIPALLVVLAWSIWRTVFKKDLAVGLALYATLLVLVDGFFNTGLYIPGLEQGSIKYSEICAIFLLIHRPPAPAHARPPTFLLALVVVYFVLMTVSALRADPLVAGIFEFRKIMFPQMLAFFLAYRGLGAATEFRRFVLAFTGLIFIVAAFCFWDVFFDRWLLKSDMLFKGEYGMNRKQGRFGSVFLNPNFLGAFVVLCFPMVFAAMLSESKRKFRIYLGLCLLALLFCLVQTQSRGPLLAFACAAVILVLGPAGRISRRKRMAGLLVGLLAFAAVLPGFFHHATKRFALLERETTTETVSRATIWQYTRQLIADNPLLGIGFGERQFLQAMAATDFRNRFYYGSLDNPHNSYLQMAVYAGLPALFAFAFANMALLGRAVRSLFRGGDRVAEASATFGLSVGIAGFLVSTYPDMHLFTPHIAPLYWLLAGLLISMTIAPPPASGDAVRRQRSSPGRAGRRLTAADVPAATAPATRKRRPS